MPFPNSADTNYVKKSPFSCSLLLLPKEKESHPKEKKSNKSITEAKDIGPQPCKVRDASRPLCLLSNLPKSQKGLLACKIRALFPYLRTIDSGWNGNQNSKTEQI